MLSVSGLAKSSRNHQVAIGIAYLKGFAMPRKPSFARYLREARIRRGLSVTDVAEQVGVSTASIYFWETDHCRPRDANLTALCRALKLPIRATREMAAA